MEIIKQKNGSELTLFLKGELNTSTASKFDDAIKTDLTPAVKKFIIDMKDLSYLSSAGLRVLLVALKIMQKQGEMIVRNVNESIMDIFAITGFNNILTIEN